jgi:hypothetical protein
VFAIAAGFVSAFFVLAIEAIIKLLFRVSVLPSLALLQGLIAALS